MHLGVFDSLEKKANLIKIRFDISISLRSSPIQERRETEISSLILIRLTEGLR